MLKGFISKQFRASLNTLLHNMLKEIVQKAITPAVDIKILGIFRTRAKLKTLKHSGPQAY